ncbi:MAG: hypothetical protein CMJ35_04340 [Phycisphaerae bacterium]|nr:hypothetical protein [Phycisphaerae bacterium]MBM90828.1 hypothetical protein [Phycisphaerae bacterium]
MAVLGTACLAPLVSAQSLGTATYRAFVSTPEGESDTGFLPVPTNTSFSYNGTDSHGNTYSYTGEAYATGGRVPLADIQAAATGRVASLSGAAAEATISYAYRVMPIAGSTRSTVPLVISVAGKAAVSASSAFAEGYALAESIVRRPGSSSILVSGFAAAQINTISNNPSNSYNFTQSVVVGVGSTGQISIRARGELFTDAEVSATADPTIVIDPDATYEEDGQTYSYADEFMIEYSETIEQWVACAADLNGDGVLDFFDVSVFVTDRPDYDGDGGFDFFDLSMFLADFSAGCP